ncbi:UNVERIFIED_ORG: hypothetical protein ABIC43_004887 [Variovorax guangxiensis]
MDIYHDPEAGFEKPRLHPYISVRAGEAGFVDFKVQPEQIELTLEDFLPLSHEPAIQAFYTFLRWLNGPESILESCDCALRGPEAHTFDHSSRALCIHGRLMLMYRDPSANCDERSDLLYDTLANELDAIDPEFKRDQAAVGFAQSAALYKSLCRQSPDENGFIFPTPMDPGLGQQLMLIFQAFGHDREEAFRNLRRVFENIELACREASKAL